MPAPTSLLPASPATPYVKPTLANTLNGKTYKPTHPELFKVELESSGGSDGEEETFSSRLVAAKVGGMVTVLFWHVPVC
jgi:hypothetical protein